jgi:hypothetical protein
MLISGSKVEFTFIMKNNFEQKAVMEPSLSEIDKKSHLEINLSG